MKTQKPINLDLCTIKFPVTAIISILHRISGIILFVIIGILLWMLKLSLESPRSFSKLINLMHRIDIKLVVVGMLTMLVYHLFAGIRHILMDCGYFKATLFVGRITSYVVFLLTIITTIFIWNNIC